MNATARPASKVEVSSRRYEFAHGHAPRGFGVWFFECDARHHVYSSPTQETFSAAKANAKRAAAIAGVSSIHVGS